MITTTADALIADVVARPADPAPLLILADWYADQGDADMERACRWMAGNGKRPDGAHGGFWWDRTYDSPRQPSGLPALPYEALATLRDDVNSEYTKWFPSWPDAARSLGAALAAQEDES